MDMIVAGYGILANVCLQISTIGVIRLPQYPGNYVVQGGTSPLHRSRNLSLGRGNSHH
ncbi:hypothetical protein CC86DRAFT_367913 [Ophiobolus disseminans]|uniref:Uncharacterized protein n=1 Tax=Ophiobolus disseminans TaxID=1469910 RepID=A0A6A7ABR6_9PLEO|nr:hypothetical protein CC86DRAFT_367913 [Ophiobolus disseminans]